MKNKVLSDVYKDQEKLDHISYDLSQFAEIIAGWADGEEIDPDVLMYVNFTFNMLVNKFPQDLS